MSSNTISNSPCSHNVTKRVWEQNQVDALCNFLGMRESKGESGLPFYRIGREVAVVQFNNSEFLMHSTRVMAIESTANVNTTREQVPQSVEVSTRKRKSTQARRQRSTTVLESIGVDVSSGALNLVKRMGQILLDNSASFRDVMLRGRVPGGTRLALWYQAPSNQCLIRVCSVTIAFITSSTTILELFALCFR